MLTLADIQDKLAIICGPTTKYESRIYIEEYDMKFERDGAIYSSKEERFSMKCWVVVQQKIQKLHEILVFKIVEHDVLLNFLLNFLIRNPCKY